MDKESIAQLLPMRAATLTVLIADVMTKQAVNASADKLLNRFASVPFASKETKDAIIMGQQRLGAWFVKLFGELVERPPTSDAAALSKWAQAAELWSAKAKEVLALQVQHDAAGNVVREPDPENAGQFINVPPLYDLNVPANVARPVLHAAMERVAVALAEKYFVPFVVQELYGFREDLAVATGQARLLLYRNLDWLPLQPVPPATSVSPALHRSQLINLLKQHQALATQAFQAVGMADAVYLNMVMESCKVTRPVLYAHLELVGAERASKIVSGKHDTELQHALDAVLDKESVLAASKAKKAVEKKAMDRKVAQRRTPTEQKEQPAAAAIDDNPQDEGHQPQQQRRNQWRSRGRGRGRGSNAGAGAGPDRVCYRCGKPGHFKGDSVCTGLCPCGDHHDFNYHALEMVKGIQQKVNKSSDAGK